MCLFYILKAHSLSESMIRTNPFNNCAAHSCFNSLNNACASKRPSSYWKVFDLPRIDKTINSHSFFDNNHVAINSGNKQPNKYASILDSIPKSLPVFLNLGSSGFIFKMKDMLDALIDNQEQHSYIQNQASVYKKDFRLEVDYLDKPNTLQFHQITSAISLNNKKISKFEGKFMFDLLYSLCGNNTTYVYTDASTNTSSKCSGFAGYFGDEDKRNFLGVLPNMVNTSFAECIAIECALKIIQEEISNGIVNHYTILSDSLHAITLLEKSSRHWEPKKTKRNQLYSIANNCCLLKQRINKVYQQHGMKNLRIGYVKGHCGIHGNSEADRMASIASGNKNIFENLSFFTSNSVEV